LTIINPGENLLFCSTGKAIERLFRAWSRKDTAIQAGMRPPGWAPCMELNQLNIGRLADYFRAKLNL
jgi:hypothetical protein